MQFIGVVAVEWDSTASIFTQRESHDESHFSCVCVSALRFLKSRTCRVKRSSMSRTSRRVPTLVALIISCVVSPTLASAGVAVTNVATGNYTSGNNCSITSLNASTGSPNLILLAVALINGSVSSAPVFNTSTPQTFTQIGTMVGSNNIGELFVYQFGQYLPLSTASITISLNGASGCVLSALAFFWSSFRRYASYKFVHCTLYKYTSMTGITTWNWRGGLQCTRC